MSNLLMISGDRSLAEGKRGAFYNTLEEFHKHWERIDIITPSIGECLNGKSMENGNCKLENIFGNVFIHPSPWPLIFQPLWIYREGLRILKNGKWQMVNGKWVMTIHEYPPFYNGIGARLLWNKTKTPYVLEIMHIPGYPKASSLKERFYRTLFRIFIRWDAAKAKAIRVINQKQTPEFLKAAGINEGKIKHIPAFYIDLNVFRPLNAEKKYDLVFAARLEKNKGIASLLQAISNVKIQIPNVKLLIIGSGPLKTELQDYVKRNRLEHNVFFSGWLETLNDVARAYNGAKIFINPSLNEGGPRVVLEAMACGLPVITTRVGLMLDIIHNGENGLFIDWSPNDMAEKIISLLKNRELQNKFSETGLESVKQFERKEAIKNYANKLQSLI